MKHNYSFTILFFSLFNFAARPGFETSVNSSSTTKSYLEPVPVTKDGLLPVDFVLEDPDSHFIYVCEKMDGLERCNLT